MKKNILLTFDLEEFDLPVEFGCPIALEEQMNISGTGLKKLAGLLSCYNIPATFFTTSFYAEKNEDVVKDLAAVHEIASHSKYHSQFCIDDLTESRLELEKITGKQIYGLRMPRFRKTEFQVIKDAGYRYDSSINPTCIPGRYNNLLSRKKLYRDSVTNLIEIPVSVSPVIRFPLFWLSFKNVPFPVYLNLCKQALWHDSYINLCFHPWEFADLDSFNIPNYIKRLSGEPMIEKFGRLITELMKTGSFSTISGFLEDQNLR